MKPVIKKYLAVRNAGCGRRMVVVMLFGLRSEHREGLCRVDKILLETLVVSAEYYEELNQKNQTRNWRGITAGKDCKPPESAECDYAGDVFADVEIVHAESAEKEEQQAEYASVFTRRAISK